MNLHFINYHCCIRASFTFLVFTLLCFNIHVLSLYFSVITTKVQEIFLSQLLTLSFGINILLILFLDIYNKDIESLQSINNQNMFIRKSLSFSSFVSSLCKSLANLYMSPTLSKTLSFKYDYLYDFNVLSQEQNISCIYLPLLNPYSTFIKQTCNPWMQINSLVIKKLKGFKEYFSTSKYHQYISTTFDEKLITLQISQSFLQQQKIYSFTPIHFGDVRIILTYHGIKGQLVVACLSFLTLVTTITNMQTKVHQILPCTNDNIMKKHDNSSLKCANKSSN